MIRISDARVINPFHGEVIENCEILIEGTKIVSVATAGSGTEARRGDSAGQRSISAAGKLVMPGMVCSHHHYYSGLARGIVAEIGPTPDFPSILAQLWWRLDRALDEEDIRISSLICSMDAIRSGTTAVIDHHSSPSFISGSLDAIADGFVQTGLRGASCYETSDRNGPEGMEAGIEENRRFAEKTAAFAAAGDEGPPIRAHIGGHAPFTLPDDALRKLGDLCESSGTGFHVHVAEDRYDASHSHAVHRKDLLRRLADFGLLGEKSIMVHGLFLSGEEIALLNDSDTFLAHNPRSNMNNNVGYNRSLTGIRNLALGTDGIGADMFEEFKFAAFKHRDDGGPWFPGDMMPMLGGGNEILRRLFGGRFGRIAEGYAADIIILDYPSPTPLDADNFAGHLAFGLGSSSVNTSIINGNIVMENRKFPFDEMEIYADAAARAPEIWKRINSLNG
jgi:putative selenium metabolism protein SsnA